MVVRHMMNLFLLPAPSKISKILIGRVDG
jgi:hypothetical protein